jgi:predicted nucleotidyltransferase
MKLLPRDFIETREGLIFAVVSAATEDGRALAFLRYIPHHRGRRKLDTAEANAFLREHHPHYLHYSHGLDSHLHGVPMTVVATHHCPRRRVRELLQRQPRAPLEDRLRDLLSLLVDAGVPIEQLGVTGSLLIGQQHAESDLDLVVYDRAAFLRAQQAVGRFIARGLLQDLDETAWDDAYRRRNCELSRAEFLRHERRKGNKGMIGGCKFDLALVASRGGSDPEPGWRKAGRLSLQACVTDATLAYDQPACYLVDHESVSEIYSFTHTYAGQARTGEWVEACGELEVSPENRRRLVIGSSREAPGQYLRVLWGRNSASTVI